MILWVIFGVLWLVIGWCMYWKMIERWPRTWGDILGLFVFLISGMIGWFLIRVFGPFLDWIDKKKLPWVK